jgi:protein-tyrosine-phosphatase
MAPSSRNPDDSRSRPVTKTVLFLCPHNAAKSVLAVAYFQHLATRAGLDMTADSAGTEPDDAVWPSILDLLRDDGVDVTPTTPRHVTSEDLTRAHLVVSLGCDLSPDQVRLTRRLEHWDDVPLASKDPLGARDTIKTRVRDLIAELRDTAPTPTS